MSNAHHVPTPDEVAAVLRPLSAQQLGRLAEASGVSYHTLLKIRDGDTTDPRVGTVSQFWPHVAAVVALATA